ncbi:Cleavage and polyadenylation specificity factor subunit 6 [Cichlidogyrus casuarinus]|uniref:Cleavage and polyadenylation specificity factor subunit 6 n=1 Tax=Cichlidogyrus casuarinus TaxID=1844966 RepID=A0ABD2Q2Q7_9PLAT
MASDELDLYGSIDEEFVEESHDTNELFDDVVGPVDKETESQSPLSTRVVPIKAPLDANSEAYSGPRIASYVGNLTWWTTDEDINEALKSIGIIDILQIKFHENRLNGQSKGFCVVVLASHTSVEIAREKLPSIKIHGRKPVMANCNKRNLQLFDQYAQESSNGGSDYDKTSFNPNDFTRNNALGNALASSTFRTRDQDRNSNDRSHRDNPLRDTRLAIASMPPSNLSVPPPGFTTGLNPAFLQPAGLPLGMVGNLQTTAPPTLNMAAFSAGLGIGAGAIKPEQAVAMSGMFPQHKINELEFEEMLQKNKTIASSAINRAVQDAASGEFASAIETLVTAISLVKQSKISGDERCKLLINTLQETLSGIESRSYSSKYVLFQSPNNLIIRSGGRTSRRRRSYSGSDSEEDYNRRRDRHHRRRSRSRSRNRDRHRRSSPSRSRDDHHHRSSGSSSARVEYFTPVAGSGNVLPSTSIPNMMPNSMSTYRGGSSSHYRQ